MARFLHADGSNMHTNCMGWRPRRRDGGVDWPSKWGGRGLGPLVWTPLLRASPEYDNRHPQGTNHGGKHVPGDSVFHQRISIVRAVFTLAHHGTVMATLPDDWRTGVFPITSLNLNILRRGVSD